MALEVEFSHPGQWVSPEAPAKTLDVGTHWLVNIWMCWEGDGHSQAPPSASVYLSGLELILYNKTVIVSIVLS